PNETVHSAHTMACGDSIVAIGLRSRVRSRPLGLSGFHPKPLFEARGKETAKRLRGPRRNCLNGNYELQFRCQAGNLRLPCICDLLSSALSRKIEEQPRTARVFAVSGAACRSKHKVVRGGQPTLR